MENLRIAVIGAGIGGLGVSLALYKKGFRNIRIFEADPSFDYRRQGYGLTILQASQALRALNILEKVKSHDTPSSSHYLFEPSGKVLGFFGRAFIDLPKENPEYPGNLIPNKNPSASSKYNLHIPRQKLRQILYEEVCACPEISISWKRFLLNFSKENFQIRLDFSIPKDFEIIETGLFDLVIGSDGIYSSLRKFLLDPLLFPQQNLNYLGCVVVLGIVHLDCALVYERVWQTMDGSTRLFVMPFSLDPYTVMWQLSFPIENLNEALQISKGDLKPYILQNLQLNSWHQPVPEMISLTCPSLIMATPVYDRNPLDSELVDSFVSSNAVLLGDALHPMSPFKGQGANQALLDGILLANILSAAYSSQNLLNPSFSFDSQFLLEPLRHFTVLALERSKSKVIASRNRAKSFHSPAMLSRSNGLLAGLSNELLDRVYSNPQINAQNAAQLDDLVNKERHQLQSEFDCSQLTKILKTLDI